MSTTKVGFWLIIKFVEKLRNRNMKKWIYCKNTFLITYRYMEINVPIWENYEKKRNFEGTDIKISD